MKLTNKWFPLIKDGQQTGQVGVVPKPRLELGLRLRDGIRYGTQATILLYF